MGQYLKVTEKELSALIEISETISALAEGADEGVAREAANAERAIENVLKRNGLERVEWTQSLPSIPNNTEPLS